MWIYNVKYIINMNNKKFKTPLLRPMRINCGTLYTFSSALEDIGLNINERNNLVKLSNYAVLNIPTTKSSIPDDADDVAYKDNNFNFQNILGNYAYFNLPKDDVGNGTDSWEATTAIPASFQSYALNLETAILSSEEYNPTTNLTVSERVFWKWLKESGAIRWRQNGAYIEEEKGISKTSGFVDENYEEDVDNYNTVVQAIGEISSGSFKINTFGNFNEVLIQLPSSFGTTPVKFKQVVDENYYFGQHIECINNNGGVTGYGESEENNIPKTAFYDYIDSDTHISSTQYNHKLYYYDNEGNKRSGWWYTHQNNKPSLASSKDVYIMDVDIKKDTNIKDNTLLEIATDGGVRAKMVRSNYDCMCIDFDVNAYKSPDEVSTLTLADLAMKGKDYDFNSILIYYSIYDNSGAIKLETNLLGILFLDGGVGSISKDSNGIVDVNGEMFIPTLQKYKTDINEFGNSFNFRINIQSNNLTDDTTAELTDTTSLNYLDDFTKVYGNLNQAINILGRHTKTINYITNQYLDLSNSVTTQYEKINRLEHILNTAIDKLNIDIDGLTTPTIRIGKNIGIDVRRTSDTTVVGYEACLKASNLERTVAIGTQAGYECVDNTNNVFIGYKAGYNENSSFKLHIESNEDYTSVPLIGGDFGEDRVINLNSKKINIPEFKTVGSGIALTCENGEIKLATSSRRYKENILPIEDNNVLKLNPCQFNYITDVDKKVCYGLIAEEVEQIDKNLIVFDKEGKPEGVKYEMLSVLLLQEVKRLREEVDQLRKGV